MNGKAATAPTQGLLGSRFQPSQYGDSGLAQNALYRVVRQTRGVVVKMEQVFFLVVTEFLKAVGVGKLAQRTKVFRPQALLQFVGSGH